MIPPPPPDDAPGGGGFSTTLALATTTGRPQSFRPGRNSSRSPRGVRMSPYADARPPQNVAAQKRQKPTSTEDDIARGDLASAVRRLTEAFDGSTATQEAVAATTTSDGDGRTTGEVNDQLGGTATQEEGVGDGDGDWRSGEPAEPQGSGHPTFDGSANTTQHYDVSTPRDAEPQPLTDAQPTEEPTLTEVAQPPASGSADGGDARRDGDGRAHAPGPIGATQRRHLLDGPPMQIRKNLASGSAVRSTTPRTQPARTQLQRSLLDDVPMAMLQYHGKREKPEARTLALRDAPAAPTSPETTSPDKKRQEVSDQRAASIAS